MAKSPFLESVRTEIRTRQYSYRTEKSYLYWVRQFILFNDKKHPEVMSNPEIERFLNHLAVNRGLSPGTQNQALCAISFVYKHVLKREIENLQYKMTKTPRRMPTVLNPDEVAFLALLNRIGNEREYTRTSDSILSKMSILSSHRYCLLLINRETHIPLSAVGARRPPHLPNRI